MIHAKKMVLVPFESYANEQEIPKAPAPVGDFSLMDKEMESILKDKKLNDSDKWAKYEHVLQRYMIKLQRSKRNIAATVESSEESDDDDSTLVAPQFNGTLPPGNAVPDMDQLLSTDGTKAQKLKCEKLYNLLSKCSNITWDKKGMTTIGTRPVGKIGDLLQHCMVGKPKALHSGWGAFSEFLKSIKVPITYVNNLELKDILRGKNAAPEFSGSLKNQSKKQSQKWVPYS
jgi:hypothetical protein